MWREGVIFGSVLCFPNLVPGGIYYETCGSTGLDKIAIINGRRVVLGIRLCFVCRFFVVQLT